MTVRIARLSLLNWCCYAGTHILALEPKAYAVIAHRAEDVGSSNWAGKSSLLEAITFALYGRHRYRTEDEFITRGEEHCEVEIELDGGTRILRTRDRGKTTKLYFYAVDEKKPAMKQEAQDLIVQLVGLSESDFLNTCAFEQRQMARMILAKPEERMGIISAWLRLGPLEACSDKVGETVSAMADKVSALTASIAAHEQSLNQPSEVIPSKRFDVEARRAEVVELQDRIQTNAERLAAQTKIAEFDRAVIELERMRCELAEIDTQECANEYESAMAAWHAAGNVAQAAQRELREKRLLVQGQFDGVCPVAAIACPAKDQINVRRKENEKLCRSVEAASIKADATLATSIRAYREAEAAYREVERKDERLGMLATRVEQMAPAVEAAKRAGEPVDQGQLRQRLDAAQERLAEALSVQAATRQAAEAKARSEAILTQLRGSLEVQAGLLTHWREAGVIFRKARQKVAEEALAEIEDGANRMLRECAIDLQVEIRWSREGAGLAKACDACGSPYPSSARVKECQRCGATRGPQMVNKLEVTLSDRSGAAEDLGGAAIQLAASAWLRNDRGSEWETALFDEPMSQLDKSNRRAFGAHLNTMLSSYGITQSLVIAHSPDFLDALPGRILIESKDGRSSVKVVA